MPPAAGIDVDINIAIVFAVKAIREPSGEKYGSDLDAHVAGETAGFAAIAIHNPKVAAVAEGDLCAADSGLAQERSGVAGLRVRERNAKKDGQEQQQVERSSEGTGDFSGRTYFLHVSKGFRASVGR